MRLALAFLSLCVALTAGAQEKSKKKKSGGHPPVIEGTKSETYRQVGDTETQGLDLRLASEDDGTTAARDRVLFRRRTGPEVRRRSSSRRAGISPRAAWWPSSPIIA
jgi:hypothetical protein